MKLKVGDIVEFKKYEDMSDDERMLLFEENFSKSGKVKEVTAANEKDLYFSIEESPYCYSSGSVARVISDVDDVDVKTLKRKEPEHFIVQDDNYGMYIIGEDALSYDKSKAKVYSSRNEANEDAADMHLNAWEVLPYGD